VAKGRACALKRYGAQAGEGKWFFKISSNL
jgi:hypothetical protein